MIAECGVRGICLVNCQLYAVMRQGGSTAGA